MVGEMNAGEGIWTQVVGARSYGHVSFCAAGKHRPWLTTLPGLPVPCRVACNVLSLLVLLLLTLALKHLVEEAKLRRCCGDEEQKGGKSHHD